MIEEPNSQNHHKELEADTEFPPELAALTARLTTDGALWQSRLPDAAWVAERIRAIAPESPGTASVGGMRMTGEANTSSPPEGGYRPPRTDQRRRTSSSPWGRYLGLVAAVVVVALLATVLLLRAHLGGSTGPIAQPTPTQTHPAPTTPPATATPTSEPVHVYFSKNPESYNDPTAVFPVQRVAPSSEVLAAATFAIQQLIAGPTSAEKASGYFTELTNSLQQSSPSNCGSADFTLALNKKGSIGEQGTATLQFCRATALAGDLTGPRIKAELTATLRQFPALTKVVILDRSGNCFDDAQGANACLH